MGIRLAASFGSFVSNMSMFTAILTGGPNPNFFRADFSSGGQPVVVQLSKFSPYIVDAHDYGWPSRVGPECAGPSAGGSQFGLSQAPLPVSFNPWAWPQARLYACIRLSGSGEVLGVALHGISGPLLRESFTDTIRQQWRFSPNYFDEYRSTWVRVRLNAGLPEPAAMPDLLYLCPVRPRSAPGPSTIAARR